MSQKTNDNEKDESEAGGGYELRASTCHRDDRQPRAVRVSAEASPYRGMLWTILRTL